MINFTQLHFMACPCSRSTFLFFFSKVERAYGVYFCSHAILAASFDIIQLKIRETTTLSQLRRDSLRNSQNFGGYRLHLPSSLAMPQVPATLSNLLIKVLPVRQCGGWSGEGRRWFNLVTCLIIHIDCKRRLPQRVSLRASQREFL